MDKVGTVDQQDEIANQTSGCNGNLNDDGAFGRGVAGIGEHNSDGVNIIAVSAPVDVYDSNHCDAIRFLFLQANGKIASHQTIDDDADRFARIPEDNDEL